MSLDKRNNTVFTDTQYTALLADLASLKSALTTTFPNPLNLSNRQRSQARTISNIRQPYAQRAIEEFGPAYPSLNGPAVALARVTVNWTLYRQCRSIELLLQELTDRFTDLKINAGVICMEFSDQQYSTAKDNRGRDVEGADTVYEAQNPLYDREERGEDTSDGGGGGVEDGGGGGGGDIENPNP